ncbi:MAG: T9SS type A sorting domain-containing protein, partial [Candidatus Kapabacteria bacterium]|nr:T9SS type A sorting domain-containing protein [Candidatus Kapabacteria bacterium]
IKETGVQDLKNNAPTIKVSVSDSRIVIRSDELCGKNAQITICDLLGRSVLSQSSRNQSEIVINHNLRSGFYLCNVVVGADVYSYRIMIQ